MSGDAAPERTGPAWSHWIAPGTILSLVRNTAPFLFPSPREQSAPSGLAVLGAASPLGFLDILHAAEARFAQPDPVHEAQLLDYFALCLAAHHATVATFVPTDVDSKIRGVLWQATRDPEVLHRMADLAIAAWRWDLRGISTRWLALDDSGPVSGHNGEWLSVMVGAHGRFLKLGDTEYAEITGEAIHQELDREARVFRLALTRPDGELDILRLSSSLTHNLGDVDQGIKYWDCGARGDASRRRFHRLAHENTAPYNGTYQKAAALYKSAMASEGHRHYPLRGVRALRQSPDFLLPLGPFLDEWGATIGRGLDPDGRVEALSALVTGCRKVAGQMGYYRAIAGFAEGAQRALAAAVDQLSGAARKDWKDSELQKRIAVPRASFESMMRKKVWTVLKRGAP